MTRRALRPFCRCLAPVLLAALPLVTACGGGGGSDGTLKVTGTIDGVPAVFKAALSATVTRPGGGTAAEILVTGFASACAELDSYQIAAGTVTLDILLSEPDYASDAGSGLTRAPETLGPYLTVPGSAQLAQVTAYDRKGACGVGPNDGPASGRVTLTSVSGQGDSTTYGGTFDLTIGGTNRLQGTFTTAACHTFGHGQPKLAVTSCH
jgi:hypothetical protein